ncbi:hypothetical protein FD46_GL001642 [Liquorilactobacillus oeni DSM 19972]|uniref:DUF2194 domain-containing protein n=2 Tax=Liquorilactobacillus oeni TaxID=303241 RepID=A0A0R1M8M8_9LACO|nr:hypothetical protein FD46_GL001642 [Liquorilactobacillus oeni DSM 19972]
MLTFFIIAVILFFERSGIHYTQPAKQINYLPTAKVMRAEDAIKKVPTNCLILTDTSDPNTKPARQQIKKVLLDMKVGYKTTDLAKESLPNLDQYQTVVVLIENISIFKSQEVQFANWIKDGGQALFVLPLQKEIGVDSFFSELGVKSASADNEVVPGFYSDKGFMIGSGKQYKLSDPFKSARRMELSPGVKTYAWTDKSKTFPLVWKNNYGKGQVVVDNLGVVEKVNRGIYAASYSLLGPVGVYPVINGSAFYLDDFPSPVPNGDGKYVKRDYHMSIADFYSNVWWPDLLKLSSEHGVRFTGVIIENYGNQTDGKITPTIDTSRFRYLGNMLLHADGELGFHGYNHQPLNTGEVSYKGQHLPYKLWTSSAAMKKAVAQLETFSNKVFPATRKSVYVPPSNIISPKGIKVIRQSKDIKTIASVYFPGDAGYAQEFGIAKNGLVNEPRVISGALFDNFTNLGAFSELNMHYVNTHFMHPDDLLDVDRGAKLGWRRLKSNLAHYMNWLFSSAPGIRNLTGSELSGAIERYSAVVVTNQQVTSSAIKMHLGNLYDESYLMMRFNENKKPGKVVGGSLQHITGDLYLLRATSSDITITLRR